jgi:nucleotide-binding universal stress UspA family protein
MLEMNKILFPCDLTEQAPKVLEHVKSIAEKFNAEIHILHVVQDIDQLGNLYAPHVAMELDQRKFVAGAEKTLDKFCDDNLKSVSGYRKQVVVGEPVSRILETIKSEGIDLVIMGTHGRKGLQHAIFGSVAENVVRKASVPVLTVNPYNVKE